MNDNKYLHLTIHDNGFTTSLIQVGYTLYNIFLQEDKFPTERDLTQLKRLISHIWYGVHEYMLAMRWDDYKIGSEKDYLEYLTPDIEIIEAITVWNTRRQDINENI